MDIAELKKEKCKLKSAFTRKKTQIAMLVDAKADSKEMRKHLCELHQKLDAALECIENLMGEEQEKEKTMALANEMEELDCAFAEMEKRVRNCVTTFKNSLSDGANYKLKSIEIPIFTGNRYKYFSWRAAFDSCIGNSSSPPEMKLLQLRQYLRGEPLSYVEGYHFTEQGYRSAIAKIEEKYGGERRRTAIQLEQLSNLKYVRLNNVNDLVSFTDELDIIVTNFKDSNNTLEINSGATLLLVKKKLPEMFLVSYERYKKENNFDDNLETLLKWLKLEAELRNIAKETVCGFSSDSNIKFNKQNTYYNESDGQLFAQKAHNVASRSFQNNGSKFKNDVCKLCFEPHTISDCVKFQKMTSNKKWNIVKSLKLCFRCLNDKHMAGDCKINKACSVNNCHKTHHYLLHFDARPVSKFSESKLTMHIDTNPDLIALRTIPVYIKGNNKTVRVNALLDEASTQTYINSSVAHELGIDVNSDAFKMNVNVLNGSISSMITRSVKFKLEDVNHEAQFSIEALTVDSVTGSLPVVNWEQRKWDYDHLKDINFPEVDKTKVDLLIGMDYPNFHLSLGDVQGEDDEPIARKTILGWTCVARLKHENIHSFFCNPIRMEDEVISNQLRRFWEQEDDNFENENLVMSKKNEEIVSRAKASIAIENGRYTVALPWKGEHNKVGENFEYAKKRLSCTLKRLEKNSNAKEAYENIFEDYEKKGFIRALKQNEQLSWFIPHFPVIRPEKETTKVRAVFDASARINGFSLNDMLETGPKLYNELWDILLRFRRFEHALICDIKEMYLQVQVNEADRKFLNFLWFKNGSLTPFQFNRLPFGLNCSPFLAQLIIQEHARKNVKLFSEAAESILQSTYMDDTLDSVTTVEKGKKLIDQLRSLLATAGMEPKKWGSNSKELLKHLPDDLKVQACSSLSIDSSTDVKTLGIQWTPNTDKFSFSVKDLNMPKTKREVLSLVSKGFDPLGLLSPFLIRAKIILQDIWLSGTHWDELLSPEIADKVNKWTKELHSIKEIYIDRWLLVCDEPKIVFLHAFADASEKAYGAVVYTSVLNNNQMKSNLVASKSRVCPLKPISIPRLELMSCVLATRLAVKISRIMGISRGNIRYYTDSSNVLGWLKNRARSLKRFVSNRVSEIQTVSEISQWSHIASKQNPADLVSRGASVEQLKTSDMWWNGPEILLTTPEDNRGTTLLTTMATQLRLKINTLPFDVKKFSSFSKVTRILAYVFRFLHNAKCPTDAYRGPLTTEEMEDAEKVVLAVVQKESFLEEWKQLQKGQSVKVSSSLASLDPFMADELIRCRGRLVNVHNLSFETRYPLVLPRKHHITRLIIEREHRLCGHVVGTNHLLARLRERFWIIAGREAVKAVELSCAICNRRKAIPLKQQMAPLPQSRTQMSLKPFSNTSVDFAGPFMTRQGRRRAQEKRYLCIFVCQETRGVHLELAYSLTSESFIRCLERFIARRGVPELIISDNGRNFVGAQAMIHEMFLADPSIQDSMTQKGIVWKFNPPSAPHFGGTFETMVKAAKKSLFFTLQNANCSDEELYTAFSKAEFIINSRPLTVISNNVLDDEVLTPNHFLFGQPGGKYKLPDECKDDLSRRWKFLGDNLERFWRRWLSEWVLGLRQRPKWKRISDERIDEGTLVLVLDVKNSFNVWALGKIVKLHRGTDNLYRTADVKVGNTIVTRPFVKLAKVL